MELLAKLGINWGLLLAQVVNFTILLTVLTVFLYRPLLDLLDRRSERIRRAVQEAKEIEEKTKELDAFRTEQLRKIDQECGAFLERAKHQAEAMKREVLAESQREANRILEKAKREIAEERSRVYSEVLDELTTLVVRLTEKLLQREFTPSDQSRLIASLRSELPTTVR